MAELEVTTLKSICTLVTDGTHDTPKTLLDGFPFIKAKQIANGYIDFDDCEFISYEDHLKVISRSKPEKGDTLFAHIGATLGATAYINTDEEFSIKNVALFKPDPEKIDPRYLYYLVLSDEFQARIKNYRTGAAQPFVSLEILRNQSIKYFADITIQRKITVALSNYDDLIEINKHRIRILEQMAQSVYSEWFGSVDAKSLPEGWDVAKLSDLVETQYGYTESANEIEVGPKFVRGMDINKNSYIKWNEVPYCPISKDELPKYKLSVWDILVIRMADPGKAGIVEKEIDAVFASYLIRLKIKSPKLSPYFLFYFLLSNRYKDYITGASTGTTRKSASAGVITDIDIFIPPDHLRQKFEDHISFLRQLLNNLLDKNVNLRQTRDLLLQRLMSGEVDVDNIALELELEE
jgi:type I restriction enzyme S subunit